MKRSLATEPAHDDSGSGERRTRGEADAAKSSPHHGWQGRESLSGGGARSPLASLEAGDTAGNGSNRIASREGNAWLRPHVVPHASTTRSAASTCGVDKSGTANDKGATLRYDAIIVYRHFMKESGT